MYLKSEQKTKQYNEIETEKHLVAQQWDCPSESYVCFVNDLLVSLQEFKKVFAHALATQNDKQTYIILKDLTLSLLNFALQC